MYKRIYEMYLYNYSDTYWSEFTYNNGVYMQSRFLVMTVVHFTDTLTFSRISQLAALFLFYKNLDIFSKNQLLIDSESGQRKKSEKMQFRHIVRA